MEWKGKEELYLEQKNNREIMGWELANGIGIVGIGYQ